MQQNSVRPILEKGSLICPQCGEGKMPTNRTCCWHCGVPFDYPFAVSPQEQIPEAQETQQPMKTSSARPVAKKRNDTRADFEKSELAHSCKVLHIWLSILCAAMGILWFMDTATEWGYFKYSLMEAFDKGFIAICAVIFNGCAACSGIIVSRRKDGSYSTSFYGFMFGLANLFNLLGMWSLNGIAFLAGSSEELYLLHIINAFSSDGFPYASDLTALGKIFTLIEITFFILIIAYDIKYRKLKRLYRY